MLHLFTFSVLGHLRPLEAPLGAELRGALVGKGQEEVGNPLVVVAFACCHSLEAPTPAIACDGSAALDGIAPVWGRSGAGSLWLWAALREAGKGVFVSMSASPNETALSPESPRISSP